MENILEKAIVITPGQYRKLDKPEFVGQTTVDMNGTYWMVFKDGDTHYKIKNQVFTMFGDMANDFNDNYPIEDPRDYPDDPIYE